MEDRVVCSCLDVTYNTIKEAIENGAKTLDDIKDETEAVTEKTVEISTELIYFSDIEHIVHIARHPIATERMSFFRKLTLKYFLPYHHVITIDSNSAITVVNAAAFCWNVGIRIKFNPILTRAATIVAINTLFSHL